jgi:hypothetical protein
MGRRQRRSLRRKKKREVAAAGKRTRVARLLSGHFIGGAGAARPSHQQVQDVAPVGSLPYR